MKVKSGAIISFIFKACLLVIAVGVLQTLIVKERIIDNATNTEFTKDTSKGDLVYTLSHVAALPPHIPINRTCFPPPLPRYPSCKGETGLTGKKLAKPRKVVLMILFAFEVDTLEIALREQMDLLDKIFIVESTITHKGKPKPLMWERLKFTERFNFVNASKVVHVVADDQGNTEAAENELWFAEKRQTFYGVDKVRSWANISDSLQEDDIFISGDVDEVLSRQALSKLKWCETSGSLLTGALWMPMGNFNRALKSDYPVSGRPHTFGLPSIYLWSQILSKENGLGNRLMTALNGRREKYIRGGLHMTNHAFLPSTILKELTATEDNFYNGFINTAYLLSMNLSELDREQENLYNMEYKQCWLSQCDTIDKVTDVEKFIPWFLSCNTKRYPYWFGSADSRNEDLLKAMQKISYSLQHTAQSYWEKSTVKKLFKHSIFPISNSLRQEAQFNELLDCTMYENFK